AEVLCPQPVTHADRDQVIDAARHLVSEGADIAIVTMAEFGVGYASADGSGHVPALKTEIVDPTGAGDAFTAAVIFALHNEIPLDEAVLLGVSAASLTLRSPGTVAPDLSLERLYDALP
ncbi:MAG: PfkB family carbohydrate kinase, partial [Anaerolineales bacterium]